MKISEFASAIVSRVSNRFGEPQPIATASVKGTQHNMPDSTNEAPPTSANPEESEGDQANDGIGASGQAAHVSSTVEYPPTPVVAEYATPPSQEGIFSARARYGFEFAFKWNQLDSVDSIYLENFRKNLGLGNENVGREGNQILQRFVASNHVGAAWYNRNVRKQKYLQSTYFIFSLLLLIAVPVLIYVGPELTGRISKQFGVTPKDATGQNSFADISTRLTVLLTGLFAVHKAISAWVNQRNRIGPYWKARAQLVDVIYTVETNWGGRDLTEKIIQIDPEPALAPDFRLDLIEGIEKGREIVRTETADFFEKYAVPQVALGDSLKSALGNAQALTTGLKPATTKEQEEKATAVKSVAEKRREIREKIATLKAEITALENIREEFSSEATRLRSELEQAKDATIKKDLDVQLLALQKQELSYRVKRDDKKIELAALEAPV